MQPVIKDHFANVPAFLTKLWRMVCDPNTDDLICWSRGKNSFIIQNRAQFWYDLLPLYYKHNNMSSFVRQLNMYGFHKIPSTEHGPISDADKDEIQFYHPYFQDGHPELLKLIKRKATMNPKNNDGIKYSNSKGDDITKVLMDVKHLQGKQASVDSQLSAMKQENALLWRELAVLRQKHSKQQQIVNKLIHFLVSMVNHPSPSRMGVSMKRHYPLMLRGSPMKKSKGNKNSHKYKQSEGPTIHELDDLDLTPEEEIILDKDCPMVTSPLTPMSEVLESDLNELLEKKELKQESESSISAKNVYTGNEKTLNSLTKLSSKAVEKVPEATFPTDTHLELEDDIHQDSFLDVLNNRSYNMNIINNNTNGNRPANSLQGTSSDVTNSLNNDLALATFKNEQNKISTCGELDNILETTQGELDQFKDILNGCNTLDANVLLGLFNNESPEYGLSFLSDEIPTDPNNISGSELAQYGSISFEELLDDSMDTNEAFQDNRFDKSEELNTPQISKAKPVFPKANQL